MSEFCPLIKENCKKNECMFYTHLLGTDPQTGAIVDKFGCAITFIPVLLVETAQQSRGVSASVDSFRNKAVGIFSQIAETMTRRLIADSPEALPDNSSRPGGDNQRPIL